MPDPSPRVERVPLLLSLLIIAWFGAATTASAAGAVPTAVPTTWREVSEHGPWVVLLDLPEPETVARLSTWLDVWGHDPEHRQLVALVHGSELGRLAAAGLRAELDEERTRELAGVGELLPEQGAGIPGFPCYRTVEETLATGASIAAAHPGLATWIDVGDSWQKSVDPEDGWDLFVLELTRSSVAGPKPVFFANFAIHAREYTTAELGTRFAERLVAGYGSDPDITWLLDHHEVHLMLQSNPDGRKRAETGSFWRKNTNNDYCSNTSSRGADLNRNFEYEWSCCGGSSGDQCSDVYRGPSAASEPEIAALQAYVRSIFPDQRGPNVDDPAPANATGVAIDVHSFSELVLWPWGFTGGSTANGLAFQTLGRKLAFFNGYFPLEISDFTLADGSSADFYYGDLGIAGLAFEIGTNFFQSCASFEANVLEQNLDALLFAAKVARTPYLTPSGPEAFGAEAQPAEVEAGEMVTLSASLDDSRFSTANGTEPAQTIASAQAFLDSPPWSPGASPIAMAASDGTFDEEAEVVEVELDTTGLAPGRHLLFVRGVDSSGQAGVVTAAFLDVVGEELIFADGFEDGAVSAWSLSRP